MILCHGDWMPRTRLLSRGRQKRRRAGAVRRPVMTAGDGAIRGGRRCLRLRHAPCGYICDLEPPSNALRRSRAVSLPGHGSQPVGDPVTRAPAFAGRWRGPMGVMVFAEPSWDASFSRVLKRSSALRQRCFRLRTMTAGGKPAP